MVLKWCIKRDKWRRNSVKVVQEWNTKCIRIVHDVFSFGTGVMYEYHGTRAGIIIHRGSSVTNTSNVGSVKIQKCPQKEVCEQC